MISFAKAEAYKPTPKGGKNKKEAISRYSYWHEYIEISS